MLRVFRQSAVRLPDVAHSRYPNVHAARFSPLLRVLPAFTDAPKLEGSEREHDPQHELARRGRRVELTVSSKDNAIHLLDALDSLEPTDKRSREAVDPRDHHAAGLPVLNPCEYLLEGRPIHLPTRAVEVGEHLPDLETTRLRESSALLLL